MTDKEKFNLFTVEAVVRLSKNYEIIFFDEDNSNYDLKDIKISKKEGELLREFGDETMKNPKSIHMWLYWSMDLPGTIYFLDEFYTIVDKIPVFTFTIQYHLKNRITSKALRTEIKEIFKHYNDSGDISYSLQSFRVISSRNLYGKKSKISVVNNTGKAPLFFNFWE
jgi:hypothetical protein